jgi:hypothetical protein
VSGCSKKLGQTLYFAVGMGRERLVAWSQRQHGDNPGGGGFGLFPDIRDEEGFRGLYAHGGGDGGVAVGFTFGPGGGVGVAREFPVRAWFRSMVKTPSNASSPQWFRR